MLHPLILLPVHYCCWLRAFTIQKSILGVQAPGILLSNTVRGRERERERESCSDVESSRGWPLSFHLPLPRSHISSLRHPNHKVRNTAPYKGDQGVGVELHALVSSIRFKSPGSTQRKCDYIKNNCVSLLSRRWSKRVNPLNTELNPICQ